MNLCVVGKKYIDHVLSVKQFTQNETNPVIKRQESLGGLYNITNLNFDDHSSVSTTICGVKRAVIVNEFDKQQRSSLTWDEDNFEYDVPSSGDWIHVMYVDDINDSCKLLYSSLPFSIDFCTTSDRTLYSSVINSSQLVFDSRERKHLYKDVITKTPLVFHDKYGCEVVIENQIVYEHHNKPIKISSVNGAGDIFAAFFIQQFLLTGLEDACIIATDKTVNELKRINYE